MRDTVTGILVAAAIIGGITVIGKAILWVWGILRNLARVADDWTGEPSRDGKPAQPGVLQRLASIEELLAAVPALETRLAALDVRLAAVEAQLQPNGGGSLRDAIDKLAPAD